jgi:hypothetical protein
MIQTLLVTSQNVLDPGDQTFSFNVAAGAIPCDGGDCVPLGDQKLYTVSMHDLVTEAGALAEMPAEVKTAVLEEVYGSRLLQAVENDVAPGGRFASHYAQIAVSKAEVADIGDSLATPTCTLTYTGADNAGGAIQTYHPTMYLGLNSNCKTTDTLDTLNTVLSGRCDGDTTSAARSCHKVHLNGYNVPVSPFTDIATTQATTADEVGRPYLFGPRSRTSLFTEASVERNADGTLERTPESVESAFCRYVDGAYDPGSEDVASCVGQHQCDPDPDSGNTAEWTMPSFQDTCFSPMTPNYGAATTYDEDGNPLDGVAFHSVGPEAGTPPPGPWNVVGAGYESVLLESYPCDPAEGVSQNVLFAVNDTGAPLCLFDPSEKLGAGASIHVTDVTADVNMPATAPLHKVMFYSPVHVFVKEGTVQYKYTIRATMPMYWGLLVGDLYGTANPAADIAFPLAEDFHVNLAYSWNNTADAYAHPGCQAGRTEGEPCRFDIGMVMNTRYHAVLFPCMDDGSGNCAWSGQDYDHIDTVSLHGATNLDYSTARFVTRISVSQLTVGGAIGASTFVAGAALDMTVASKTCHKHETNDADIVFNIILSGLDELFTVSTSYVEYYYEDTSTSPSVVHRVVFENNADSCTGTVRADSIPAGPCYNVQATPTQVGATEHSVAVSVRLPLDQCRTELGATVEDCIPLIRDWLSDSGTAPQNRKIFIGYTMGFGAGGDRMGFLQRQEVDCGGSSLSICNALLRPDAVAALEQCESSTAEGGSVTVSQQTNLVAKTLAVVGQPTYDAINTREPCKLLNGNVVCPALLHDQCEAGTGVASVQHVMEACGAVYSDANIRLSNGLASGGGNIVHPCTHLDHAPRTLFTGDCHNLDSATVAECNAHYQPIITNGVLDLSDNFGMGSICAMDSDGGLCERVPNDVCAINIGDGGGGSSDPPCNTNDGDSRTIFTASCLDHHSDAAACNARYQPLFANGDISNGVGKFCVHNGALCLASSANMCAVDTGGRRRAQDDTPVTSANPVRVLGNGLGYLHLGAASGPQIQPTTQAQQARQLIFPIGAKLTATCPDTSTTPFERQLFGGKGTGGTWFMDLYEWENLLGMDTGQYTAMVNAVENKAELIDDKLVVADPTTTLSRTNDVAVDSKAMYDKAQSLGAISCDVNDVKPFTFLGSERAEDHCDWMADTASNPFSDACHTHINGGLDVQGLVAKGKTNAVVHGAPDTVTCNSGPAMVLGFNDQSPQYLAYANLASDAVNVKVCPGGTNENKLGQTPSSCLQTDADQTCDGTDGFRGCALRPMEQGLNGQTSFYDDFKNSDTNDGRGISTVMSAFGVNINTAYLSQCGAGPTEWKLETQFFHVDGITPINGYNRRSLADATVSDVVTTSLHVNATAYAGAPHRTLQDDEAERADDGAIATAVSQMRALPCADTTASVIGVFGTTCLCDKDSVARSSQCDVAFFNDTHHPPPPPPGDDDNGSSSGVLWIVLVLAVAVAGFAHKQRTQTRSVVRSIKQDYRHQLL